MTSEAANPLESDFVAEQMIFRHSPVGPIATTVLIGVFVFSLFLGTVAIAEDFPAFLTTELGNGVTRIAFVLTLIMCAALAVSHFDHVASCKDFDEMERLFGIRPPQRKTTKQGMRWASLAGLFVGLCFLGIIVYLNSPSAPLAFFNPVGLWFTPMTPLLWVLLARGIYSSFVAGRAMTSIIRDDLEIDVYHHHDLVLFGRIAMRGAFIWLIFVGIILLFFAERGLAIFAEPMVLVALAIGFFSFISTMQPVKKKIRAAKAAELARIRADLLAERRAMDTGDQGSRVPALIALEARVEGVREWPLDLPTAARLPLYLLIPVVPWAAGVYAETFLEGLLGGG